MSGNRRDCFFNKKYEKMKEKDKISIIRKIILLPYYDVTKGPKSFKLWWVMFYYVFLVIAIIKLTISAAHNVWQFLAVVGLVFLFFNCIPYQICRLIIFIFRKKVSKKEKTTSWLIVAVIVGFSCFITWSILSERKESEKRLSNYGIKYELISEEKLDKVCVSEGVCSTTVKKVLSSNDGFIFETFLSDGSDSVWCGYGNETPCSTVGDYGGGRNTMRVTSKKTNKSISVSGAFGNVVRKPTPIDYPYIVFEINTGGASCCTSYELYSKENLTFISKSESNKYSK